MKLFLLCQGMVSTLHYPSPTNSFVNMLLFTSKYASIFTFKPKQSNFLQQFYASLHHFSFCVDLLPRYFHFLFPILKPSSSLLEVE